MKKIITMTCLAVWGLMASVMAADTQYKVYDLQLSLKAAKAGGIATTACGDSYAYRVKGARKIQGVIAGCGCLAMAGDDTCVNFNIYLWDVTTKTQLTNFTFKTELLQRIGKKGDQVEHVATIVVEDQDGEKFELVLAGFGTYTASKSGTVYDRISVSGGVTGTVDAPYKTTPGCTSCCGFTPDVSDQTTAVAICEEGTCTASDTGNISPVYGTYLMKHNSGKAAKCERTGLTAKNLGLPAYVKFQ